MNKEVIEEIKNLSREERTDYFKQHKEELLASNLEEVNGGTGDKVENPDSEVPYKNNYYTSWGFVCNGEAWC